MDMIRSSWLAMSAMLWLGLGAFSSTQLSSVRLFGLIWLPYALLSLQARSIERTNPADSPSPSDPMQLVDELSMIYTTCLVCYATFSYSRSRLFSLYLALALISLAIFITLYYHYLQDPVFHQRAYALLTATALLRSLYVMLFTLHPSLKKSENKYRLRHEGRSMNAKEQYISRQNDKRDHKILKTMWIMIAYGLSTFMGGFAIWFLDRLYCNELRIWRRELGLPWGILLEGHGWW